MFKLYRHCFVLQAHGANKVCDFSNYIRLSYNNLCIKEIYVLQAHGANKVCDFSKYIRLSYNNLCIKEIYVLVAQSDRALVSEAKGHGFDSRRAQLYREE